MKISESFRFDVQEMRRFNFMKAEDLDNMFAEGEGVLGQVDLSKIRHPNQE